MTTYYPYPDPTATPYPAEPEPPRRRRGAGLVAVVAAVALVAGGGGAALGVSLAGGSTTVTNAGGTPTQTVLSPSDEDTVASVAAAVTPSVVTVNVSGAGGAGTGSGVILTSDGAILTNNHVVAGGGTITVEFSDGTRAAATVVGTDPSTDIAVIQAQDVSGLPAASFADSDDVVVGELVIAIGSPLGLDGTVTSGVVSAVDRPVRTGDRDSQAVIDAIQTDAAINPGNSGGALLDADGNVIGINSAIATVSDSRAGSIGVGFAIPSNTARQVAAQLIRNGVAVHAQLGVEAGDFADEQAAGAQLRTVTAGGPAAEAGLRAGDVVVAMDDRTVENVDTLIVAVRAHAPGDTVAITYLRDGEERTTTATLTQAATS